jgi:addiction module HigA family antidote
MWKWSSPAGTDELIQSDWRESAGPKGTEEIMDAKMLIHPGEILKEEFLDPYGLNANQLAVALDVPPNRITGIIHGDRGISAESAVLFAHAFGTSPEFWLNLQARYDLDLANSAIPPERIRRADKLARELRAA